MLKYFLELKNESEFSPNLISLVFNPFYIVRADLFKNIKVLAPFISGNVLDVGCGSKPYKNLFINNTSYVGLEYESSIFDQKKVKVEFTYKGDVFPFTDSSFDSIVCFQVLEHVFKPDKFVIELNRVLRKQGKMLITVPFVWDEHEQPFDYGRYSSFGLRSLLEQNGFKVIRQMKSTNGFRGVLQLFNLAIFKYFPRNKLFKYLILPFPYLVVNLISKMFPEKENDFYIDNIILVEKI